MFTSVKRPEEAAQLPSRRLSGLPSRWPSPRGVFPWRGRFQAGRKIATFPAVAPGLSLASRGHFTTSSRACGGDCDTACDVRLSRTSRLPGVLFGGPAFAPKQLAAMKAGWIALYRWSRLDRVETTVPESERWALFDLKSCSQAACRVIRSQLSPRPHVIPVLVSVRTLMKMLLLALGPSRFPGCRTFTK